MVVADASSVILLAKAGVLQRFASNHDLTIPETVYEEAVERGVETGRADAYRIKELIDEEDLIAVEDVDETEKERITDLFGIAGGETAAVAAGRKQDELVLVDDRKGINACKALDHPFTTALDIVVALYEDSAITQDTAVEALNDLEEYGWYKRNLVENRRNQITEGGES